MTISPYAGKPATPALLANIPRLITAFYTRVPDGRATDEQVQFGTSGHRGSSIHTSFNEWHILAITQAICLYRATNRITGPLFIGADTHALSEPAFISALEVLAANGVDTMIASDGDYVPTPAVSLAILEYNRGRRDGMADGIVITPSHNPPTDGGFKYNPPNGGPAGDQITAWVQDKANQLLAARLEGVKRVSVKQALAAPTTHPHDFRGQYIEALDSVIDLDLIRHSGIRIGADPLGGAGVHYWQPIADRYRLNMTVVNHEVDPTFRFMTVDWDGQIRMDPSSAYAMHRLIGMKDRFDVAVACDTDHDRHGIVTPGTGLLPPNHYLSVCIDYLFRNRPGWSPQAAVGKTLVSSSIIDRVAARLKRRLYEVPVGFKWFVDGLMDHSLGFVGEESAGASFLRKDGSVWTTDKDGITAALLAAEITARTGKDPGELYRGLVGEFGEPVYDRVEAKVTPEGKAALKQLSGRQVKTKELAGEKIVAILTTAPGNNAAIGGLKVATENGWFAARPSGTENIYKIYAESFKGKDHLTRIIAEAQTIVDDAIGKK